MDKAAELRIRLDSKNNATGKSTFGNVDKRNDAEFYEIDKMARVGLSVNSHLTLLLAYLDKRLCSAEVDDSVSAILHQAVNAAVAGFDQLARISCRAVVARRRIALSNVRLPDMKWKEDLMKIPLHGEDLFGGKFSEKTRAHAQILEDMKTTGEKEASWVKGGKRPASNMTKGFEPSRKKQATGSNHSTPAFTAAKSFATPSSKPASETWASRNSGGQSKPQSTFFRGRGGKFFQKSKNPAGGRF